MKRLVLAIFVALVSVSTFAQFEQGTKYANISLGGLQMQYSRNSKFSLDVRAAGGYFVINDLLVLGHVGYKYDYSASKASTFELGAAARYYFRKNGIFVQGGLSYDNQSWTDSCPVIKFDEDDAPYVATETYRVRANNIYFTPEVGYCFYVNRFLSIEPSVYYDISLNHIVDYSRVGLRLSAGFYF